MDYLDALERAVLHIENNLGTVTGEEAAKAAGYSYYHFTRIFAAVLGESVGSYIRSRRLSDSAHKLVYSEKRILDIALENGFETPEAFSRAFKAAYRISPTTYRRNRLDVVAANKLPLDRITLRHYAENITLKPEIVELEEIKVVGLRGKTSLKDNVIPKLWQEFWKISDQIPDRIPGGRYFGISEIEAAADVSTMNDEVIFTEVVGAEVFRFAASEAGGRLVNKVIEAGRYAVFTHRGSLEHLQKTYAYIWGSWIFSGGVDLGPCGDFELYDERYRGPDDPASEFDIYIQLK